MNRLLSFILLLFSFNLCAQNNISGSVVDKDKQPLVGVNIYAKNNHSIGTSTDFNGNFSLNLAAGCHTLVFQYIGYQSLEKKLCLSESENKFITISLVEDSELLSAVVVSAGKFEQKIEEVTVSMDVIKPSFIENKAANSIDKTLKQAPSIHIVDGQANIRSGSGWSYGTGSRVMVMVDGMPLMSGDQGAAEWQLIPMENISQVEVIKGASSVLFGSSALNGTINIRTAYPSSEPTNKISFSHSYYGAPKRQNLHWYKNAYHSANNLSFFHAHKKNNQDFVLGANLLYDGGYQYKVTSKRARINLGYTKYSTSTEGLQYGLKVNLMRSKIGDAIMWEHDTLAYNPLDNDPGFRNNMYWSIDPYISYRNPEKNSKHSINARLLHIDIFPGYQDSLKIETIEATDTHAAYTDTSAYSAEEAKRFSNVYYIEYQYQKQYEELLTLTTGITNKFSQGQDVDIYGIHKEYNASIYTQADFKYQKLNLSLGGRFEHFNDGEHILNKPIFRSGINYQLTRATWLRSSYGEGIRFPSILERYVSYNTGPMYIYANPDLKPEAGWSAEIGIKQAFKLGAFKGFIDLAAFKMKYDDMMEFSAGFWGPLDNEIFGLGFKSINIGQTIIEGIELSIISTAKLNEYNIDIMGSYTYTKPYIGDINAIYAQDKRMIDLSYSSTSLNQSGILKYRYEHLVKLNLNIERKRYNFGLSIHHQSSMNNIDAAFNEPLFNAQLGTTDAWDRLNRPVTTMDLRIAYDLDENSQVAFNVDNVQNVEHLLRPASLAAPRTYSLLYKHSF